MLDQSSIWSYEHRYSNELRNIFKNYTCYQFSDQNTKKTISQLISISVTSIVMHVFSKQQQDTGIKYRTFHKFERRYYITLYVQAKTFSMKMLKNAEDRSTYECMRRYEFKEKYQYMNRTLNRKIFWWNLISIIQISFIYGAVLLLYLV